jgi:hypothetical protein
VGILGVGLAVVARYVRNMKGQIRVQSELGKGTIFGIELPFEHAPGSPADAQTGPSASHVLKDVASMDNSTQSTDQRQSQRLKPTILLDGNTLISPDLQTDENSSSIDEQSDTVSSQSGTDPSTSTFPFPEMDGEIPGPRLSVLIAEDNPVNARVLTRRLEKLGHEVELALDGQQCHDHFASKPHTVDVILMDLQVRAYPPTFHRTRCLVLIWNRCH